MRILFLGDVMGRAARKLVMDNINPLRDELSADFIIVNVENSAGGFGVTPEIADQFLAAGADVMTTGNHVWDKREIVNYIMKQPLLLRPYNMVEATPGEGYVIVTNGDGKRLAVMNVICNLFMAENEPVFPALDRLLDKIQLGRDADAIFLDVHGEATSEKTAVGFAADGKCSAVVGTHTHIPTADHRILPGGTAYQTDAGMCGDYISIIGMQPEAALGRFKGKPAGRLEVAKGEASLCGVIIDTDDATGLATAITPFRRGGALSST
ncbi:MAG: TIGR00282 family metallophosphoesterase [Alphaproteobacteria bacterium]|nr:TIGR00282 family metallophosphoesterase [Alphaproteobacteria bacterium]